MPAVHPDSIIFTLSAPSGAGKTSLARALIERLPGLRSCVSHTTRPMRKGECDGVNYHFLSMEAFNKMAAAGAFLECAKVYGHQYGTSLEELDRSSENSCDVILDIDWQGAQRVSEHFPQNSVRIFVMPPSKQSLLNRLRQRGQDHQSVICARMDQAKSEMSHFEDADYLIFNEHFEDALQDIEAIVHAERLKLAHQLRKHSKVLQELLE